MLLYIMYNNNDINNKINFYSNKYSNKYNIILIITNSYKNSEYIKLKSYYNKYLYKFHKLNIIFKTIISNKFNNIEILLINNKNNKFKLNNIKISEIKKLLKDKELKKNKKLSLYANYNPNTTIKNLGYKDKDTALKTIDIIKNKDITYQKRVLITLINRAKFHPHITKTMKDAIKIFKKRLKNL